MRVLEALDWSREGLHISGLARLLGIPKSSAHVILVTLENLGYVKQTGSQNRYTLSLRAYNLGREMLGNLLLPNVALPHMRQLAAATRMSVNLAILERDQGMIIQKVDGPGFVRFDTYRGKRAPLHCNGVGKVLLAFGDPACRKAILSKTAFSRHTKKTIVTATRLRKELEVVAAQGYALDDEEEELEVRCLAVPVYSPGEELIAALSVSGTLKQIHPDNYALLVGLLRQAASRVTEQLITDSMVGRRE